MCGIIGYAGTQKAVPKLIEGLTALEYRGYDSAGVAFFENSSLTAVKSSGRIEMLKSKLGEKYDTDDICCGIGHTRWATHGEPSDRNSHPHGSESLYIIHNGIIENYSILREFLLEKGYTFESETDTETAAKLIDFFYSGDPVKAIRQAQKMLSGSYAICVVFKDFKNTIYAFRKDNPIIAAPSVTGNFISSDISAVLKYTRQFRRLEEREIAIVTKDCIKLLDANDSPVSVDYETVTWDISAAEKGGYPHFMLKEIHEEPQVISNTLRPRIKDGLPDLGIKELSDEVLKRFERIHIVACGTAMHAGLIGKYAIEKLARISVNVYLASEFRYQNPILGKNDLVIVISQSGETADTLAALRLAKERGIYTLGVVNVMGSAIAREADSVIYTWAGPEIAVASTKAYSVQLALMYLFALRLAYAAGRLDEQTTRRYSKQLLEDVPKAVEITCGKKDECKSIAKKYKESKSIFFIGRGLDYAICCEAALKMKEISYIHCEAYAAGELKHGTISLVTDGVPVFAFATDSSVLEKTLSNIKETSARGARVVAFCGERNPLGENVAEDTVLLPQLEDIFMPLVTATILQLVAYYMSFELGLDVDKPRNLAKSVTVE